MHERVPEGGADDARAAGGATSQNRTEGTRQNEERTRKTVLRYPYCYHGNSGMYHAKLRAITIEHGSLLPQPNDHPVLRA